MPFLQWLQYLMPLYFVVTAAAYFNSSGFSYSSDIIPLAISLQLWSTFPLLAFIIITLGHRVTYGNCEGVNTNLFEQYDHTTILIQYFTHLILLILSRYIIYIHFFYLFSALMFFL